MVLEQRIPLSRAVRWRRFRAQTVPLISFAIAVVACGWLWQYSGTTALSIGEVDSPRVHVTSPTAGLILSLPHQDGGELKVYDHVKAGDVIAHVEDRQLEDRSERLRAEIQQLMDQVDDYQASAASNPDKAIADAVLKVWQYERSQLQSLDRQLVDASRVTDDQQPQPDSTPSKLPEVESAFSQDALLRLRKSRDALGLRVKELQSSNKLLEIVAPISGTLVAVHCWPRQAVPPGGMIATIAADHGRHIVGYIPEESPLVAKPGMPVTVRSRTRGSERLVTKVEQVGMQIERIPSHQRSVATTPQWGTPVRIKMPMDAKFRPGSLVDVFFHASGAR